MTEESFLPDVGEFMAHVETAMYPCPCCRARESYDVHENAVVWRCGFVRPLPPTTQKRWEAARERNAEKRNIITIPKGQK